MDKEEKKWVVITIAVAVVLAVVFGVPAWMELYNIPPPDLLPFVPFSIYAVAAILGLSAAGFAYRKRIKIRQTLDNKYLNKLQRKIQQELETEAQNKHLTFPKNRLEFLPYMATNLARSIVTKSPPITYVATLGDHIKEKRFTMINQYGSMVPFNEGEIIAKKMTEISKKSRYRKKVLFLLLP